MRRNTMPTAVSPLLPLSPGFSLAAPPPGFVDDPYPFYDALRAQAPVHELAPGSLSSVSGDGLTVPYGNTDSGVRWLYDTSAATNGKILDAVTPEGKRISLSAAKVDARPGSTVKLAFLTQEVRELEAIGDRRVIQAVSDVRTTTRLGNKDVTASQLAERLGSPARASRPW